MNVFRHKAGSYFIEYYEDKIEVTYTNGHFAVEERRDTSLQEDRDCSSYEELI